MSPERDAYVVRDFLRRRHSFVNAAPSPPRLAHTQARRAGADEAPAGEASAGRRAPGDRPAPAQGTFDLPVPQD